MTPQDLLMLVCARVRDTSPGDRPCLVAVDGADGAGKTTLARSLVAALNHQPGRADGVHRADEAHRAVAVSVDGFHRPREQRYARGRRSPEGFWLDSYDYGALHRELLGPWRAGSGCYRTAVHDVVHDVAVDPVPAVVPGRGVLVVDGIFLLREELAGVWDLSVRLEVTDEERFRRMAARDGSPADPSHPDNSRYLRGQQLYERACEPAARADLLVEATDGAHPRLLADRTVTRPAGA